jgi:hypothetical protein
MSVQSLPCLYEKNRKLNFVQHREKYLVINMADACTFYAIDNAK